MTEGFVNFGEWVLATATLTAGANSLAIVAATPTPPAVPFRIVIGTEVILVGGRSGTTFSSLTRGAEGSTAAQHVAGDAVRNELTFGNLAQLLADQPIANHADVEGVPTEGTVLGYLVDDEDGTISWQPVAFPSTVTSHGGLAGLDFPFGETAQPEPHPAYVRTHAHFAEEIADSQFQHSRTLLSPVAGTWYPVWIAPFPCVVTAVKAVRADGTAATINARKNGASNHLASALSLTGTAWLDGGAVQNAAYVAGDHLQVSFVTLTGVTLGAIQVNFRRPA